MSDDEVIIPLFFFFVSSIAFSSLSILSGFINFRAEFSNFWRQEFCLDKFVWGRRGESTIPVLVISRLFTIHSTLERFGVTRHLVITCSILLNPPLDYSTCEVWNSIGCSLHLKTYLFVVGSSSSFLLVTRAQHPAPTKLFPLFGNICADIHRRHVKRQKALMKYKSLMNMPLQYEPRD